MTLISSTLGISAPILRLAIRAEGEQTLKPAHNWNRAHSKPIKSKNWYKNTASNQSREPGWAGQLPPMAVYPDCSPKL